MALLTDPAPASETGTDSGTHSGADSGGTSLLRWLGAIWFGLATILGVHRLSDNSFLTHLATGRLILAGHVPHVDPYSFTAAGRPWVVQSWLASVIDATVERVGGLGLLRWMTGALIGLMVALIWRLTARGGDLIVRVAVTALATGAGLFWWGERPQMLAFVLMGLMLVVVIERRSMWWLAPIFAVWVNVHASWPVGLALLGAVGVTEMLDRRSVIEPVAVASVASIAGALLSPYGWSLLRFPIDMAQRSETLRYIVEWRPPKLVSIDTGALVVLLVLVLVGVWRTGHRARLVLAVVVGLMAALSARNVPVGALALVPVAAAGLVGVGSLGRPAPLSRRTVGVVGIVILGVAGVVVFATPPHVDLDPYPVALVDRLERHRWIGTAGVEVIAPDYVGNYLEARYGTRANVFIDDRAEVYPLSVVEDYVGLLSAHRGWQATLARYQADVVIWPTRTRLSRALRRESNWHHVASAGGFDAWCNSDSLLGC